MFARSSWESNTILKSDSSPWRTCSGQFHREASQSESKAKTKLLVSRQHLFLWRRFVGWSYWIGSCPRHSYHSDLPLSVGISAFGRWQSPTHGLHFLFLALPYSCSATKTSNQWWLQLKISFFFFFCLLWTSFLVFNLVWGDPEVEVESNILLVENHCNCQ